MSGRDRCYALPELQQWDSAQVDHYVWGSPGTIHTYARAQDAAGQELAAVADELARVDVSGFWTGPAATAFTQLRDRVAPAVARLAAMHTDSAAALGAWQRHLAVYQEDTAAAITLGRQGWRDYQTSCQAQPAARTTMDTAKSRISDAMGLRDGSARTAKAAIEAATAKADAPTPSSPGGGRPQTANPNHPPSPAQVSTTPRRGRHRAVRPGAGPDGRRVPRRRALAVRRPGERPGRPAGARPVGRRAAALGVRRAGTDRRLTPR